jgi:hypothetical protein
MNREQFIAAYVTNFLSAYMATEFSNQCLRGWPLMKDGRVEQPIEDAFGLAKDAWEQIIELQPDIHDGLEPGERIFK